MCSSRGDVGCQIQFRIVDQTPFVLLLAEPVVLALAVNQHVPLDDYLKVVLLDFIEVHHATERSGGHAIDSHNGLHATAEFLRRLFSVKSHGFLIGRHCV